MYTYLLYIIYTDSNEYYLLSNIIKYIVIQNIRPKFNKPMIFTIDPKILYK